MNGGGFHSMRVHDGGDRSSRPNLIWEVCSSPFPFLILHFGFVFVFFVFFMSFYFVFCF
jgi:hypothetical protein